MDNNNLENLLKKQFVLNTLEESTQNEISNLTEHLKSLKKEMTKTRKEINKLIKGDTDFWNRDREWIDKIHIETLIQLKPWERKPKTL